MAFSRTGFRVVAFGGAISASSPPLKVALYASNDTLAAIVTDNYFDTLVKELAVGDQIMISADLDGTPDYWDTDTDNDGLVDTWTCADGYTCNGADNTPDPADLTSIETGIQKDFLPLNPKNITVTSLYAIVSPLEDPYRAFGEAKTQVQPQVTLVLTVTLSSSSTRGLLGQVPSITLQRTVSTGVYSKIPSYE